MVKYVSAAVCSLASSASTLLEQLRMGMDVDVFLHVCLSVEVPRLYKVLINPLLLAPTSQLQCDTGASPQPSFSIDSSGTLHHNATTDFVACVSGQSDQLNIYTNPPPSDVTGCQPILLHADRCQGAPTQPPSGPPSVPQGPPPGSPPVSIPPPISPPPVSIPSPIPPPPVVPPPISPSPPISPPPKVSSSLPGPSPSVSPIVPPQVPPPPEGSTSRPITTLSQVPPAGPGVPPGQPGGGPGGPTTSGAPNTPAESSGPRTPSAPGGVPTAPGPPPFANSSVATPTGACATGLCPTGGILPTGTSGPGGFAPGAGGGGGPSGGGCGTNLINGSFEFPHLIIPIDSSSPNKVAGTSFNGTITSTISSIFNFDFLPNSANKQCSLVFLFPTQDKLETSAFTFSGDGAIRFLELQAPASSSTSFSNAPQIKVDFGVTTVSPGNTYTIATFACPAGQTVAFELKNAGSTNLDFFEDFNPAP
ncbi:uncharacterized protein BHQ10_007443 [Talaromyces amestolkiae]|uniref:Uncharacterized protein n=1 Tax=Talaromyces amestolkiae TaxID=1196081 RepID=A0A364L6V2_TALAM|nr:uncharacterized protein BHQ10_007443 [Talaromyces amestolkiae]RAO71431.1 hypothetical protein BHQ10_007443 [Talaromyces amestolkiae]